MEQTLEQPMEQLMEQPMEQLMEQVVQEVDAASAELVPVQIAADATTTVDEPPAQPTESSSTEEVRPLFYRVLSNSNGFH